MTYLTAVEDGSLVPVVPGQHGGRWLLALGGCLAALLTAYLILMPQWLDRSWKPQPSITTDDQWRRQGAQYVLGPPRQVVIVGSSLSVGLTREYFAHHMVFNLALSGGSLLTGLEIVLGNMPPPGVLLIESNVLDRPVDANLLARFSGPVGWATRLRVLLHEVRPVRQAVAEWHGWGAMPESPVQVLLDGPPETYAVDQAIQDNVAALNARNFQAQLQLSLAQLEDDIAKAHARGIRVVFMRMPWPEGMETTTYVSAQQAALQARFGGDPRIRWMQYAGDRTALRWWDGTHLDPRSLLLVAKDMEAQLAAMER